MGLQTTCTLGLILHGYIVENINRSQVLCDAYSLNDNMEITIVGSITSFNMCVVYKVAKVAMLDESYCNWIISS